MSFDFVPDPVWVLFQFIRPALALFNMLLLFWLGLTVLLQVERRRSSVWFASFSLLMAAAFFGAYTIEMGGAPGLFFLELVWIPALILLHILPLCWHIVVLYFTGQFDRREPALAATVGGGRLAFFRRWPRGWLPYIVLALCLATPASLAQSVEIPGAREFARGLVAFDSSPRAYTIFLGLFCAYILFAAVGSLIVLARHRMTSGSLKQTGRLRARASFLGAGLALAAVSLVVTALCAYIVIQWSRTETLTRAEIIGLFRFDSPLSLLIAIAILFTGRATIYYELFSGALPRRGLFRQWHLAVTFAMAAGVFFALVRWFFGTGGFTILGTATMAMLIFVLMGRSQNRERISYLTFMRPFLGSQNLYETVVQNDESSVAPPVPFAALCRDVLGATRAYLYPIGEARPFIESPLMYPIDLADRPVDPEALERIHFEPHKRFHPLDPEAYGGALLAIPLWSRRGVAGVLLLGEQTGGGLYTQEEVEIAQAAGERIIDTLAVARISRIMLSLQRNRIIEGRLGDDRARRILHDDVLPEIHTLLLTLSASNRATGPRVDSGAADDVLERLKDVHVTLARLLREMPITTHPDVVRLGLSEALRHAAEREGGFDRIVWESGAQAERFVSRLPAQVQETVFYAAREMLRNSARHARVHGADLELRFRMQSSPEGGLHMILEDNGGGIRENSGTQGTGQGLSLHGALLAVVGGSLSMETLPGRYTRAHIRLRSATDASSPVNGDETHASA
ncbi:MAG: hypothetical protein NXI24_07455 [bacterium]|nr:hypothetical protein [bacterium]